MNKRIKKKHRGKYIKSGDYIVSQNGENLHVIVLKYGNMVCHMQKHKRLTKRQLAKEIEAYEKFIEIVFKGVRQ
jgi:Ribonuclease G/E